MVSRITGDEIVAMVTVKFDVADIERDADKIRFRINDIDTKEKFVELAQKLEDHDILCQLQKNQGHTYMTVRRLVMKKRNWLFSSAWTPRIMFGVVVAFVMLDGYYKTVGANQIIAIGDPLDMAMIYTAALLGILGVHELGHMVAFKIHRMKTSWPYFVPGLPIIGIPTFGAIILAKGLMVNREKTFDIAIAGPIAGLVIAVIITLYASSTVPTFDPSLQQHLYDTNQLADWMFGEPIIMKASLALFEKDGQDVEVLMTPLLFASWIGLFLTFANLMPAGQLDGGHMMRAVLGTKMLNICTYASAAIFVIMNFWFVALLVLLMSGKRAGITIMDEVTPLSARRKMIYIAIMALAVLCAPIPDNVPTVIEPLLHLIQ